MQLSAIDLNLLVALDALLQEGSVTRAGQRIGLSQPAMSRALSRLRELFDDPILVRRGGAMQPTPRAERLRPRVKHVLEQISDALFEEEPFDPATCHRLFTIAASDYCGLLVLPRLMARLGEVAPGIEVRIRPQSELSAAARTTGGKQGGPGPSHGRLIAGLLDGSLDLAMGTFLSVPETIARGQLFEDGFVCAVRRGHPLAGKRLTLKRFCQFGHVLVTSPSDGPGVVDVALAARGLERRVAVRVPHFSVAPAVVAETDFITTLAEKIAERCTQDLSLFRPPIDLARFPVSVLWNPLAERDAGLMWLRDLLSEVTAAFRG